MRTVALLVNAAVGACVAVGAGIPVCPAFADAKSPASATPSGESITPAQVYDKAWTLIKENFYLETYSAPPASQNWERWRHRYDGKLKSEDDAHKAIQTMLGSLGDPYTRFLDKEAFDDEKLHIKASLAGVGIQLGLSKDHRTVVIAPIEGSPADKAGIQSGDEILEVDSKPIKGVPLEQIVRQIRGEVGSVVKVTYLRAGKKHEIELTRADIPIKAVSTVEVLNFGGNSGKFGYIRLDTFMSERASTELRTALTKLQGEGVEGIILDLRGNPGGLVSNAIKMANMFIDHGVIVSTVDNGDYKISQIAKPNESPVTLPLVILINEGSASASEILSGCLRDNHRAKLVGAKSFGKGLVQAINALGDGSSINVTVARYLTPADIDIHKTGIVPEYAVKLEHDDYQGGRGPWWIDTTGSAVKHSPTEGKDAQLNKAVEVLAKELGKPSAAFQIATDKTAPASRRN